MTKIAGSGFTPKCHGSATLLLAVGAEERVRGARDQAVLHALHGEGLLARPHAVPHHQQLH